MYQNISSNIDNYSEKIFQLENKLKLRQFENINLKSSLESNNLYIEELLNKVNDLDTRNENILIREFKTENEKDVLNDKYESLKVSLNESEEKYKNMMINYSRIIDENKYINSLIKTYQQDLTTSERDNKSYKEKCDVFEAKIINLQNELDELKQREELKEKKGWFF